MRFPLKEMVQFVTWVSAALVPSTRKRRPVRGSRAQPAGAAGYGMTNSSLSSSLSSSRSVAAACAKGVREEEDDEEEEEEEEGEEEVAAAGTKGD